VTTASRPPTVDPPPASRIRELFSSHSGGFATSLITTLLAFFVGGLVVLATGRNPLAVYKGIFNGTGLNWFFPWIGGDERAQAAFNLQQTGLITTTLILTGLAVAFAFRCGLFNIGGQGQWAVGVIVSVWVGSSWADLAGPTHIVVTILLATLAGALWAGIAGILRATVGAHEVISTIMLNWIAYWTAIYLFGIGGPLQSDVNVSSPISNDIQEDVRLPVFWGDKGLQGLHIGFFIALGVLVTYWLILSRTTLGFRVRAVGRNPEAARYGGISVGKSYFLAMAISGAFAGLGGALDILGWQYRIGQFDFGGIYGVGFIGIAVALLGRNTAIGVFFSALLFGALLYGTSTRSIDQSVFDPELAGNLTIIIQGLVLVFIGADLVVLYLWHRFRGKGRTGEPAGIAAAMRGFLAEIRPGRRGTARTATAGVGGRLATGAASLRPSLPRPRVDISRAGPWLLERLPRGSRALGLGACMLAVLAVFVALPPIAARSAAVPIALGILAAATGAWVVAKGLKRLGSLAIALSVLGVTLGVMATQSSTANLDKVFVWSALTASMLRFATPLVFAAIGGMFSERSGVVNIGLEGMMLIGAFFGILAADKLGSWFLGIIVAMVAGGALAAIHAVMSIHLRADQIVSGTAVNFVSLGLTGYLFIQIYGSEGTPGSGISTIPSVNIPFLEDVPFLDAFSNLNLMIWLSFLVLVVAFVVMFRTPFGLRLRSVGEHPRAADTVGLSVYGIRYRAVILSGMLASLGGAFLSIGFVNSFSEGMTAGSGFIALAALIFGKWHPKGAFLAALLFGSSQALAQRLPAVYAPEIAPLFEALPYVLVLIAAAGIVGRSIPPAAVGIPYVKR
jgi:ABC-type uncharacterized transport system permease subunit